VDCFAVNTMRSDVILRIAAQTLGSHHHVRNRHALHLEDQPKIDVTCEQPLPVQMDGEYLGDRTHILIESVPDALSLLY
jgi:diacylglycerol kinase family enzyme